MPKFTKITQDDMPQKPKPQPPEMSPSLREFMENPGRTHGITRHAFGLLEDMTIEGMYIYRSTSGDIIRMPNGAINGYVLFHSLDIFASRGWVSVDDDGDGRTYRITEAGRSAYRKMKGVKDGG